MPVIDDIMFAKWIIFILLIPSQVTFVNGQTASILLTSPANYRLDKLNFGCSPSGDGWLGISRVTLSKNISTSTSLQEIVRVELNTGGTPIRNKTTWGTGNYQSRAQVIREYVNPATGAGIEFHIPPESVQCSDEGLYQCEVDGTSATGPIQRTSSGTVTLQVVPTSINPIFVNPPQSEFIYNPMSQITMRCTGEVGRPAGDLTWCYKNSNSLNFIGWPFASDIKQEAATQSGCNFVRSSTLTYNVSADYNFTEFKCVTGSTSCNGGPNSLSANVTIYKYNLPIGSPDIQTRTWYRSSTPTSTYQVTENGKPLSSNNGCDCDHSVAIAVSALVGVIVGGLIVVVVMHARKNLIDKSGTKNPHQDNSYTSIYRNGITQHVYNQPVTDTQAAYYMTVN